MGTFFETQCSSEIISVIVLVLLGHKNFCSSLVLVLQKNFSSGSFIHSFYFESDMKSIYTCR